MYQWVTSGIKLIGMNNFSTFSCVYIQVPLGTILKNEISHADMIAILEDLHKYVPMVTSVTKTNVTVEGEVEECCVTEDRFHRLLLGGDQRYVNVEPHPVDHEVLITFLWP